MSIYQLYGTAAAAADGVASVDIQFDGEIVAMILHIRGTFDATGDACGMEVSFLSSSMMDKNDARGVIGSLSAKAAVVTSGGLSASENLAISGLRIPVIAGERLYVHVGEYSSAGTVAVRAQLFVLDNTDVNLRRRR